MCKEISVLLTINYAILTILENLNKLVITLQIYFRLDFVDRDCCRIMYVSGQRYVEYIWVTITSSLS